SQSMPINPSVNVQPNSATLILFFFQAEDGIRDATVTGVQTCALPIFRLAHSRNLVEWRRHCAGRCRADQQDGAAAAISRCAAERSEERRVGKECRSWWWSCR